MYTALLNPLIVTFLAQQYDGSTDQYNSVFMLSVGGYSDIVLLINVDRRFCIGSSILLQRLHYVQLVFNFAYVV
jgi:hypothetical protein